MSCLLQFSRARLARSGEAVMTDSTFRGAAGTALLTALMLMCCDRARADEVCGPSHARYVEKVAAEMQQFAPRVTKTGIFSITEEYPGNGTEILVISFVDRGKTLFVYRVRDDAESTATTISPGKTRRGDPGFAVALIQGSLGSCEYGVFVRDGKFMVSAKGLKR